MCSYPAVFRLWIQSEDVLETIWSRAADPHFAEGTVTDRVPKCHPCKHSNHGSTFVRVNP